MLIKTNQYSVLANSLLVPGFQGRLVGQALHCCQAHQSNQLDPVCLALPGFLEDPLGQAFPLFQMDPIFKIKASINNTAKQR